MGKCPFSQMWLSGRRVDRKYYLTAAAHNLMQKYPVSKSEKVKTSPQPQTRLFIFIQRKSPHDVTKTGMKMSSAGLRARYLQVKLKRD